MAASSEYNHVNFTRAGGSNVGAIGWHSDNRFYIGGHPSFGSTAGNDVRVYGFGSNLHLGDNSNGDVLTIQYSSGNVGIGTVSPSYKLQVRSLDANDDVAYIHHDNASQTSGTVLKVRSDAGDSSGYSLLDVQNNTGNALYVRGDRRVGIGTVSPATKLSVSGGDISAYTSNGTSRIFVSEDGTTGFNGLVMQCNGGANNTDFYTTGTGNGMWISAIGGNSDIGLSANEDIYLKTDNGGSLKGGTTQVTVKQGGNVGIGTNSPVAKLDVLGTSGGPTVFDYSYTTNAGLRIHGDESALDIVGTDAGNHASTILLRNGNEGFGLLNSPNSSALHFRSFTASSDAFSIHSAGSNVSSLTDILTLQKSGNVGIGTD